MFRRLALTALILVVFAPAAVAASYKVDPAHSQIGFTVDHLMFFKVTGYFTEFEGTIEADPAAKTLAAAQATIKAESIDTRIEKRDNHLRSPDFFDVAKYPELTFVTRSVSGSGSSITVTGDLTMHGVTREVVLKGAFLGENKDAWGNQRAGFAAKGMINRKDFGLTWNKVLETGGVTVGDEVEISLQIQGVAS